MNCPKCKGKVKVIDSVNTQDNEIFRRRRCVVCVHEFYTREYEIIPDTKFKSIWGAYHRDGYRKKKEIEL